MRRLGSATAMGTVMIFSMTPLVLFLLIGGVVVDRLPRMRVMLVADLLSGLTVMSVALLAALDLLQVWHIYLASFIFGSVEAFFFPAYQAVLPELVPAEALPSANSLSTLSRHVTGIVGPGIGAWLVAVGGTPFAFGLDSVSFLISAACLVPCMRLPAPLPGKPRAHPLADVREGLSLVLGTPWLWVTIGIFSLINITLTGPLQVAMPFLIKDNLHAEVGTLGLFTSSMAVGSVISALWLGRLRRFRRRGISLYAATLLLGATVALTGVLGSVVPIAAILLVFGMADSVIGLVWVQSVQDILPRDKLGRVWSLDALGSWAFIPLGYALAGVMTDRLGAPLVFLVGGLATIALVGVALLHPKVRGFD
ncbi:MAG: MFS transporter [Chloroflexi bacterium]|nr:MFS transporter [Chloroflexota bacterium]